jgi:hypothetical protein
VPRQLNPASVQCTCVVRPPKPGDFDKMADLAGQLGYECTGADVRARLDGMWDPNQCAVYVAELPGGQIAGWIGVYMFRAVELDSSVEISGLVLTSKFALAESERRYLILRNNGRGAMVAMLSRYGRMLRGIVLTDSTRATDTNTSRRKSHSVRVSDQV